MPENKRNGLINIICLLFVIIPTEYITVRIFPIYDEMSIMIAIYLPMFLGYLIYCRNYPNMKPYQKALFLISIIFRIISLYIYAKMLTVHGGLDNIAQAIIYAAFFNISSIISRVFALLLLLLKESKYLFTKYFVIRFLTIVIGIMIVMSIISGVPRLKSRVPKEIKTLSDFKYELDKRRIYTNSSLYKVYGIDKNGIKELFFEKNQGDEYPEYIFIKYGNYYSSTWIIYYINGHIYAIYGDYYEGHILWKHPYLLITENNEIYTYNEESDVIEKKGKIVHGKCLKCVPSVDIPKVCYDKMCDLTNVEIKNVKYIDYNTLEEEYYYIKKRSY